MKSMNDRVVINERYRSALRPLNAAELSQLEDNIIHAGEILDPVLFHLSVSGQEVVVDGHHRLGDPTLFRPVGEEFRQQVAIDVPGQWLGVDEDGDRPQLGELR